MRLIPSHPIYSVTSYNTSISITPITHQCLLHCLNYILQSNNNPHNSFPSSVAPLASPPTRTSASSSATRRYSLTQHSLQPPYKNMVTQLPQSPLKGSSFPPPSSPPLYPRKAALYIMAGVWSAVHIFPLEYFKMSNFSKGRRGGRQITKTLSDQRTHTSGLSYIVTAGMLKFSLCWLPSISFGRLYWCPSAYWRIVHLQFFFVFHPGLLSLYSSNFSYEFTWERFRTVFTKCHSEYTAGTWVCQK